jgi:LPXTG-site transpeptidase (sortase) family protein
MSERRKIIMKRKLARMLIIIGIIGIAVSLILLFVKPTHPVKLPFGIQVASSPATDKPTAEQVASYTVDKLVPKYIEIPAIHVEKSRIFGFGLLPNGQIATPDNTNDAGWYNGSGKPGEDGAVFIFGHVSSHANNGLFHNLHNLKPGDKVMVTRGDDIVYTYQVISTTVYPSDHVDMGAALSPIDPTRASLNLMTCDGEPLSGTTTFDHRLVVFTSQI